MWLLSKNSRYDGHQEWEIRSHTQAKHDDGEGCEAQNVQCVSDPIEGIGFHQTPPRIQELPTREMQLLNNVIWSMRGVSSVV